MTKTILLTRPIQYNNEDIVFFEQLGYQCIQLPLINIKYRQLTQQQQENIKKAQWLLFTSQSAIEVIAPFIQKSTRIATIGKKTAKKLQYLGFKVDFISDIETKAEMLKQWLQLNPNGLVVYGKSQLGDDYITHRLAEYQINYYEFIAYDNTVNEYQENQLMNLLIQKSFDTVYFASPSAWQRFYEVYQHCPIPLKFIALGTTTKKCINAYGYSAKLKYD